MAASSYVAQGVLPLTVRQQHILLFVLHQGVLW